MHPSKDIKYSKGKELNNKKIALCITGSIAAIKSVELARELMRHGAEVFVVMSESAENLITKDTFEWATGNPVVTKLTGKIEHIALAGEHKEKVDLILVSPATGNTISKIACGIDDTPVLSVITSALGSKIPIIVVPAMHSSMYNNIFIKENIKKLKKAGITVLDPVIEEKKAKIQKTEVIVEEVIKTLYKKDLEGLNFLVTAGATVEYIDNIRYITNKSSGKTGIEIAKNIARRGGKVFLLHGNITDDIPYYIGRTKVETVTEMFQKVKEILKKEKINVFISAAAISDWEVKEKYKGKLSSKNNINLRLIPSKKIINEIKKISPETLLVIFKAEYNISEKELIEKAYNRLKESNAQIVVANDVSKKNIGFGAEENEVIVIDKNKNIKFKGREKKSKIAETLIDIIKIYLKKQ